MLQHGLGSGGFRGFVDFRFEDLRLELKRASVLSPKLEGLCRARLKHFDTTFVSLCTDCTFEPVSRCLGYKQVEATDSDSVGSVRTVPTIGFNVENAS